MAADLAIKEPVRVATTGNITLSGLQTIDGVALSANDRVLVRAQSTATQNGLYTAASGSWTRATDFDGAGEVTGGTQVYVQEGSTLGDIAWRVAGDIPLTPGTDVIAFKPEFIHAGTDAVPRALQGKSADFISLLDYIPVDLHAGILANSSTTDVQLHVQDAIDAVEAAGGGTLFVPAGRFRLNATVEMKQNVMIRGAGRGWTRAYGPTHGTSFWVGHNGDGFKFSGAVNGVTLAFNGISDCSIYCIAPNESAGAAYWDRGGTSVHFTRNFVHGFKYGVIFDQTELGLIEDNGFLEQKHSCVWLTNGDDLTPTAATNYTNRLSVNRNNFDQPVEWCILDDGGFAHAFRDNNYNGGKGHIRIAGYTQAIISGGEFEGASDHNIVLSNLTLGGDNVGQVETCLLEGALIAAAPSKSAVSITACNSLTLIGNLLDGSGSAVSVGGAQNAANIFSAGNIIRRSGGAVSIADFFGASRAYTNHTSNEFIIRASATWNPPVVANLAQVQEVFTVTGAALGDHVQASFSSNLAGFILSAELSAADTVRVTLANLSGAGIDLGSGTVRLVVTKA